MRGLLAALRFLTIMPLPQSWGGEPEDMRASVPWFPVVGVLLGGALTGLVLLAGYLLPAPSTVLVAWLVILFLVAVTKGLHFDGLADSADAFLSSRPREKMLEIMKDSHIGTMGVLAIVLVLLAQYGAVAGDWGGHEWGLLLVPVAGRCAMVILMGIFPYARKEGGLGSLFPMGNSVILSLYGLVFLLGACWIVGGRDWCLRFAECGLAVVTGTLAVGLISRRLIGGITGDVLGAACVVAETLMLLGLGVVLR